MTIKIILPLLIIICLSGIVKAQNTDQDSIRNVLAKQVTFWNKGDIDNFMVGYWNNDSLLFIGSSGPKYGYQTTLNNYKKNYPTNAAMGILSFSELKLNRLSNQYYFVIGKFYLERTIGNAEGYFTLLFKKINGIWVVVVDHSS